MPSFILNKSFDNIFMKILILALSGIGDALMFTPALSLLRRNYPDAQIDALVMIKGVKDMFERNSNINNVIHFDFLKEGGVNSLNFVLKLRKKYDVSINVYPSNRKEYNIISFLIGAKKRAAINYKRMNKSSFSFLNNVLIDENDSLHNVEENILLIEKLTGKTFNEKPKLNFELTEDDLLFSEKFLKLKNIKTDDIVIGIHPGCATLKNHIKRRWEPEKFSELSKKLIEKFNAKILLFGGPEEKELREFIIKHVNKENIIEVKTENLPQSAAVMKRCNLFISNDSSLMHVSSAMGLKVLAIIGPTNINYIHPWETDYKIVSLNLDCSPCFFYSPKPLTCSRTDVQFKCIKELEVEKVYESAVKFLN